MIVVFFAGTKINYLRRFDARRLICTAKSGNKTVHSHKTGLSEGDHGLTLLTTYIAQIFFHMLGLWCFETSELAYSFRLIGIGTLILSIIIFAVCQRLKVEFGFSGSICSKHV